MPRTVGHSKGAEGVRELVEFCAHKGVKYLTLFVASAPKTEVAPLWQVAYTELYLTDVLWPEFDTAQLELALDCHQKRGRRFGQGESQKN